MENSSIGPCPHCQAQLEPGYLGFASGLFWSQEPLSWWQSLFFFFAFSRGQLVVGNLLSTPWFRARAAHRCTVCGALLIPTDR